MSAIADLKISFFCIRVNLCKSVSYYSFNRKPVTGNRKRLWFVCGFFQDSVPGISLRWSVACFLAAKSLKARLTASTERSRARALSDTGTLFSHAKRRRSSLSKGDPEIKFLITYRKAECVGTGRSVYNLPGHGKIFGQLIDLIFIQMRQGFNVCSARRHIYKNRRESVLSGLWFRPQLDYDVRPPSIDESCATGS